MRDKRFSGALFFMLMVWIFISALYYAPNLIEGQLITERSDNIAHKMTKYAVAAFFVSFYMIIYQCKNIIIQGVLLLIIASGIFLMTLGNYNVTFGIEVIAVLMAFYGLSYISSKFDLSQINMLSIVLVSSATLVSMISYFEYSFFEPILGDFWRNTGGFRSVSTLLNPNNLGIYLSAVLLVLIFSTRFVFIYKAIIGITMLGAIYLSGSRTAWLSLMLSLLLGLIYKGRGIIDIKKFLYLTLLIASSVLILMVAASSGFVELSDRVIDPYTAFIRIEKYFQFLVEFDVNYLLPDFSESRIEMVSESGYFHFINSVGMVAALFIGVTFSLFFRVSWLNSLARDKATRSFSILMPFYAIASFFENVLMSFPNNQLFFLALGVTVASWRCGFNTNSFVQTNFNVRT